MSTMSEFWAERLEYNKTLAVAVEGALTALASDGIESYTLDTGQGRQQVTRRDIGSLTAQLEGLYNTIAVLDARVNGSNVSNFRRA